MTDLTAEEQRWKFLIGRNGGIHSFCGTQIWRLHEWNHHSGSIELCSKGLHSSKKINEAFAYLPGDILARVEVKGDSVAASDQDAWSDMRILRAYRWASLESVALAIFAAEQAIGIFEAGFPDDARPRRAVDAARQYLSEPSQANAFAAARATAAAEAAATAAEAAAATAGGSGHGAAAPEAARAVARGVVAAGRCAAYAAQTAYAADDPDAAEAARAAAQVIVAGARAAVGGAAHAAQAAYLAADQADAADAAARDIVAAARQNMFDKVEHWFTARIPHLEEIG
jgi:hypothetical protein